MALPQARQSQPPQQGLAVVQRHPVVIGQVMLDSVSAGHEADARVLQQQLSSLVTEQQAAQQYISDNPPPPVPLHQDQQGQQKAGGQVPAGPSIVDWKWDILRPVTIPSSLVAHTIRKQTGANSVHEGHS